MFAGARIVNVAAGRSRWYDGATYAGMLNVHTGSVGLDHQTPTESVFTHQWRNEPSLSLCSDGVSYHFVPAGVGVFHGEDAEKGRLRFTPVGGGGATVVVVVVVARVVVVVAWVVVVVARVVVGAAVVVVVVGAAVVVVVDTFVSASSGTKSRSTQ
jgi:hypothetical protein